MDVFRTLTSNYLINVGLTAWLCAQILKTILVFVTTNRFEVERLVGAGGMPSAHSALVCSIAVAMSRKMGVSSPEFALALTLAGIVMYDAMGVRRAAGEQAKVLNQILFSIRSHPGPSPRHKALELELERDAHKLAELANDENIGSSENEVRRRLEESKELKEYLGHTPIQVLAGALLGILIAMIMPVM